MKNVRKKIVSFGLTTALAVALCVTALAETSRITFQDVSASEWYYTAVDTVVNDLKLMSGYDKDRFGPKDSLTREQFVQILFNMSGENASDYTGKSSKFEDVNTGAWYGPAVVWAEQKGVTSGTSATTFGTGKTVTREQMAVFMRSYCELMGYEPVGDRVASPYGDADTADAWASDAVEWSRKAGLFMGDQNGNFQPTKKITRGEVAQVIVNFYSNAHDYDSSNLVEATCTTDGTQTYTCVICGGTKTETVQATGHSYVETKVDATCTKDGSITKTCTRCGDKQVETIKATGHSYDSGKVTTAATCTTTGVKTYTCTVCGDAYTETIAKIDHTYKLTESKAATYTASDFFSYMANQSWSDTTQQKDATQGQTIIKANYSSETCVSEISVSVLEDGLDTVDAVNAIRANSGLDPFKTNLRTMAAIAVNADSSMHVYMNSKSFQHVMQTSASYEVLAFNYSKTGAARGWYSERDIIVKAVKTAAENQGVDISDYDLNNDNTLYALAFGYDCSGKDTTGSIPHLSGATWTGVTGHYTSMMLSAANYVVGGAYVHSKITGMDITSAKNAYQYSTDEMRSYINQFKASTEPQAGYKTYTCSMCGGSYTETVTEVE